MKATIIVAIDGPAGAGKSTVARTLAKKLGFLHIDTGAMYRAVTLAALRQKADLKNDAQLEQLAKESKVELKPGEPENKVFLDGDDVSKEIRTPEVTQASAFIANCVPVRKILVARQQQMGRVEVGTSPRTFFPMPNINSIWTRQLKCGRNGGLKTWKKRGFPRLWNK